VNRYTVAARIRGRAGTAHITDPQAALGPGVDGERRRVGKLRGPVRPQDATMHGSAIQADRINTVNITHVTQAHPEPPTGKG
jgi:hypothetical protein